MDRYTAPPVIDTDKEIPYYTPVLPSSIPEEEIPFYYVSQEGDRWDTISHRFYGTPDKWWIIAKANNLMNGSIAIPEGSKIFIPNV